MKVRPRHLIAALALAMLPITACAPGSPSTAADKAAGTNAAGCASPETLKIWSWRPEDVDAYKKIFAAYEEKNCVKVDFQAFKNTEYNQILSTGLTGSNGPDVVQARAYGALQPLIVGGNLTDVTGKVDGLKTMDPTILAGAQAKTDGKVYGVPFATQTMQVFYNKKIFKDAGVEVPKSWDDFVKVNEKIKGSGMTPLAVGAKDAWMMPFIHDVFGSAEYGGKDFRDAVQSGKKTFTDAKYVSSIQNLKDLQGFMPKDVVGVSYTDAQVLFSNEQAAMFPGGSFELAFFQKQNPDLDLGAFQVPVRDGSASPKPVSPAYADGNWAINAKSPKQEASLKLLQWMGTKEFGQKVVDELKQFSPVAGVSFNDPVMKEIWDLYQKNPAPYTLLVDFRYGQPSGTDLMGAGVQELFLGSKDAAGVAAKVQDGVAQWFKPKS
ncbi:ABC transporter substrate-binding protein [Arthrobacter sp. CG_A4]|uniref:ABC transporter substrate-binding protein n=1 Tax=Arthrobacter sp. CG_A4 TaxID=3071706 RepID=UPI002DFF117B|nr:raffinose/stachyose/melibiose transport system substrate-binding protein [Arthrobacter sp. CG_A4]